MFDETSASLSINARWILSFVVLLHFLMLQQIKQKLWNVSDKCLVQIRFNLVHPEGPTQQSYYFIGFRDFSIRVSRKVKSAGVV